MHHLVLYSLCCYTVKYVGDILMNILRRLRSQRICIMKTECDRMDNSLYFHTRHTFRYSYWLKDVMCIIFSECRLQTNWEPLFFFYFGSSVSVPWPSRTAIISACYTTLRKQTLFVITSTSRNIFWKRDGTMCYTSLEIIE